MGNLTKTKISRKMRVIILLIAALMVWSVQTQAVAQKMKYCCMFGNQIRPTNTACTNKSRRLQAVATGYNVPAWCPALGNAKSNDACAHVSVDGRRRRLQAMITCPAYQGNVCQPNTNNRMEC